MTTMSVSEFGSVAGVTVDRYVLENIDGISVAILTYGGVVQYVLAPDSCGDRANVVLGFRTMAEYELHNKATFFGCITGRFANRIANAGFDLDGTHFPLVANNATNCLHGGIKGFDKYVWAAEQVNSEFGVGVRLTHVSPDGDEGFPGELSTAVTYWLNDANTVRIDYEATTDAPTVINLTNHTYFNLAGESSGPILDQELQMACSRYTPTNEIGVPLGELADVSGTPFDFLQARAIGARIRDDHEQIRIGRGYDHNFVIDRDGLADGDLALVADAHDPRSGRTVRVESTEPGVQLYSGNFLDGSLTGYSGLTYRQSAGFALETGHFPDSPNQPAFPSTVLRPGELFRSTTTWTFGS